MKHLVIRLPQDDLTTLASRFGTERSRRSDYIRSVLALYLEDKSRIGDMVTRITTGQISPVGQIKSRTSVFVPEDTVEETKTTCEMLGMSMESFVGLLVHAELENSAVT